MAMGERPAKLTGAALTSSSVNYYGNATGYLVQPQGETDLPAVVVIHEWWGLNQHIKDAADSLAAVGYVSSPPNVNSLRVAALGWCFGGGFSMQLALNTTRPLAATVIYYGNLVTDEQQLSAIEWPVMGVFGTKD